MQRAAIYARYSTDLQNDRSVEDQIALCEDHARRSGWGVVARFADRARSGATVAGRPGLADMLAGAVRGEFDVIVVEALDRVSRDQADLATIYKRLTFLGVQIIAVHDGRADAIQIGIRGLVSELFLTDLKHKVRRGLRAVVDDGRHAGGRAFGYRPIPGRPGELEIVEEEAQIVRRIFDRFLAGDSPRTIAADLNAEGAPAPRSAAWGASTIGGNAGRGYGILRNPLYDGRIVWNRVRMVRHPETGRRISRENPPDEWREAEAEHLRIVPPEIFAAAQRPRRRHAKTGPKGPRRLLSGLLRCGACGSGMPVADRKGAYIAVRCAGQTQRGTCANRRKYNLRRIEAAVIDGLRGRMAHPEALQAYIEGWLEERRGGAKERAKAEAKRDRARAALDRMQENLIHGRVDADFFDRNVGPLRADLAAAEAALADAPDPGPVSLHPAAVAAHARLLDDLHDRLGGDAIDADLADALRALIDRVVIHDAEDGVIEVEVYGRIGPLAGPPLSGGLLVAEARLRQNAPIPLGRFAA